MVSLKLFVNKDVKEVKKILIVIFEFILKYLRKYPFWFIGIFSIGTEYIYGLVWIICHGGYLWICVFCISTFSEIAFHESSFFFDRYILIYQFFLYSFLPINQNRLELYCEYYELNIFVWSFFFSVKQIMNGIGVFILISSFLPVYSSFSLSSLLYASENLALWDWIQNKRKDIGY